MEWVRRVRVKNAKLKSLASEELKPEPASETTVDSVEHLSKEPLETPPCGSRISPRVRSTNNQTVETKANARMLIEFLKGISPPAVLEVADDAAWEERYTAVVALAKATREASVTRIEENDPTNKGEKESQIVRYDPVIEADPAVALIITANEILHICISMCSIFHPQKQQFSVIPPTFLDWSTIQGVIEYVKSLAGAQTIDSIGLNAFSEALASELKVYLVSVGSLHRVTETFSWLYERCGLGVINCKTNLVGLMKRIDCKLSTKRMCLCLRICRSLRSRDPYI
jgi:hypothetical protein